MIEKQSQVTRPSIGHVDHAPKWSSRTVNNSSSREHKDNSNYLSMEADIERVQIHKGHDDKSFVHQVSSAVRKSLGIMVAIALVTAGAAYLVDENRTSFIKSEYQEQINSIKAQLPVDSISVADLISVEHRFFGEGEALRALTPSEINSFTPANDRQNAIATYDQIEKIRDLLNGFYSFAKENGLDVSNDAALAIATEAYDNIRNISVFMGTDEAANVLADLESFRDIAIENTYGQTYHNDSYQPAGLSQKP